MSNIPSVVSNKYQLIIGILLVCGIFSGYYAVSYIIYVVKERSKHYKYKKLNGVFISNLYARSASNAKVIASATIAIAVSILGFVVAPVLADISEEFLKFRMPYDLIHFLRREMLDFTAFPVFFVSNLLLVQRKKYYFNRATVSRNCSIVL